MKRVAAYTAFLLVLSVSRASALSGLELHQYCHEKDQEIACVAYIRGLLDGMQAGAVLAKASPPLYCPPHGGIPTDQGRLIVDKYFRDHPEELQEGAGPLVMAAIAKAFPCQPKSN